MPIKPEELVVALAHYEAGRLEIAEQLYRRILEIDPNNAEALNYLGVIAFQTGKDQQAVEFIRRAIEINEGEPRYHCNLGNVLLHGQQLDEAVRCFRRAVDLKPDYALANFNLGTALHAQRKLPEAIDCFRRSLELDLHDPEVYNNLGAALRTQGSLEEAICCFRRSLELKSDSAIAHFNLGSALQAQGNLADAVLAYRRAIELRSDFGEAHNNLGTVLLSMGSRDDALRCYRQAATLTDLPDAYFNLGSVLQSQGNFDDAISSYHQALALRPDYAEAHNNLALLLLLKGDFKRGWTKYEWRWKANQLRQFKSAKPRWNGEPLSNQAILIHTEQGFGDTIQFVRYAAVVKQRNPTATIIVQCQRRLTQMLAGAPYIDRLVAEGDSLPPFDVQVPFLSLPLIFETTLGSIPADVPYLKANQTLVEHWRQFLLPLAGFRIGINWRGRTTEGYHRRRDIPLKHFAAVSQSAVKLVSLQKGKARDQLAAFNQQFQIVDCGPDFDTVHGAFMDTAAIMKNLDLVITSDTSLPHLAGALGVPVWLVLPFVADWRWLLNRSDSPWYPTMRLFRQKSPGDWTSVFHEIQKALGERLELV